MTLRDLIQDEPTQAEARKVLTLLFRSAMTDAIEAVTKFYVDEATRGETAEKMAMVEQAHVLAALELGVFQVIKKPSMQPSDN